MVTKERQSVEQRTETLKMARTGTNFGKFGRVIVILAMICLITSCQAKALQSMYSRQLQVDGEGSVESTDRVRDRGGRGDGDADTDTDDQETDTNRGVQETGDEELQLNSGEGEEEESCRPNCRNRGGNREAR